MLNYISSFWYDLKYGLKNLWKYKKVIWNNREWDQAYILILLKEKLDFMIQDFEKNAIHIIKDIDVDIKYMKQCSFLLKRLIADDYITKEYNEYFNLGNWRGHALTKKEQKMIQKSIKHEIYMKEQDLNYLIKIFRKHYEGWWY